MQVGQKWEKGLEVTEVKNYAIEKSDLNRGASIGSIEPGQNNKTFFAGGLWMLVVARLDLTQ